MDAPCAGWTPNTALCSKWSTYSAAVQAHALRVATRVLWAATGRRFGLCAVTVRPCWAPQAPLYQAYPVGYYGEGYWTLLGAAGGGVQLIGGSGCACSSACQCSPPQIALPPVADSVTEVRIDGAVLDPSAYRLTAGYLIRMDGLNWPTQQNLAAPAGAANTWSVTYNQGEAVPDDLQDAAGLYACQVGAALTGGSCQLPNRVQSVTRQGVTIEYLNADDYLDKNRTGYDLVDSIISTYNPHGLQQRPRLLSPDMPIFR
jgi:hypothetical protein